MTARDLRAQQRAAEDRLADAGVGAGDEHGGACMMPPKRRDALPLAEKVRALGRSCVAHRGISASQAA